MGIEENYIRNLDREPNNELAGQGFLAEDVVVDFFNTSGFDTRLSTKTEDEGKIDIGPKQIIDAVVYHEGRPVMCTQITTSAVKGIREKKMAEMRQKPFLRLEEMKSSDSAIPKVLVYLDANKVKTFGDDPSFDHHPEVAIQILDGCILSLGFDLSQTKNPQQQQAIVQLVEMLESEKKKYIH